MSCEPVHPVGQVLQNRHAHTHIIYRYNIYIYMDTVGVVVGAATLQKGEMMKYDGKKSAWSFPGARVH